MQGLGRLLGDELGARQHRGRRQDVEAEGLLLGVQKFRKRGGVFDAQPSAAFPLLLPGGVRQLGLTAMGEAGRAQLDEARVVPEAVVPRHLRDDYSYPLRAIAELYRVGGPLVHATAVDRSEPEDGGFRVEGAEAAFLVDGPPAASVRLEIRRVSARTGDEVRWGGRVVPLGAETTSVLVLAMAEGQDLGRASVVPVRVRAPGAWVRFRAEGAPP